MRDEKASRRSSLVKPTQRSASDFTPHQTKPQRT